MSDFDNDIRVEDSDLDDSVVAEENQVAQIKKLREKLRSAEEKAKEYLSELHRAKADFVNMRKRDEEAKAEFVKFSKSEVLEELLPVLDALNLAVSHGNQDTLPIQALMVKILKQHGLKEIDSTGEEFDPARDEALGTIETKEKQEDHRVLEVVQKGYILSGKIIRPAKVKIGQFNE